MSHIHTVVRCIYCDVEIARCCHTHEPLDSYQIRMESCHVCDDKLRRLISQVPDEVGVDQSSASCCLTRKKVAIAIVKILPEAECGVSDAELADFFRPDVEIPSGKVVLAFGFCPWCGTRRDPDGETMITELT